MSYSILADLLVLVHAAFIVYVVAGGLLLWRWPHLVWLHLGAVAWGVMIEFSGWLCPLTPLEQHWRALAGEAGYHGSFIAHYLLPLIYPAELTRGLQWLLGVGVLVVNAGIYALWLSRRRSSK